MVRAKFRLISITQHCYGTAKTLVFQAEYDSSIPEDQRFMDATPSGRFEMLVNNPLALEQFQMGQAYYIDTWPVPVPA